MTISKDLLLAILSMDSYNRGYGAGISDGGAGDTDGLGDTKNVSKIGNATVTTVLGDVSQTFEAESVAAGFYAISYTLDAAVGEGADALAAGTTIISFRGTDDFTKDPFYGWGVGSGSVNETQAQLAAEFYQSVAQSQLPASATDITLNQLYSSGITLTGHSLGGGLARLNSRLYGQQAANDNDAVSACRELTA